jgi:glycine cleavage system aminomethyltransferase T
MAVREGVGLFDMSSFGKIRVEGPRCRRLPQPVCANEVDVPAGPDRLHPDAERPRRHRSDLTVTRLSETAFLLVVPAATLQRDLAWLRATWATSSSSRSPT